MWQPSTKAPPGSKDENISPDEARKIVGERWARKIESLALNIYKTAHTYAVSNLQELQLSPGHVSVPKTRAVALGLYL